MWYSSPTSCSPKSQMAAQATAPPQRTTAAAMGGGTTEWRSGVSSSRRPSTTTAIPRLDTSASQANSSCDSHGAWVIIGANTDF